MSGGVDSAISRSGVVENVLVAVGIASPALSVQKLFPLPVSSSGFHLRFFYRHFAFVCRSMSDGVDSAISRSGVVGDGRVAVAVALLYLSVHELLLRPVSTCQCGLGLCRQCHII